MAKGPRKGSTQSAEHIAKRFANRIPYNLGKISPFRKTTEHIVREIKSYHGDRYLLDRVNYINSSTKIEVGCKIHGYFFKWPNDMKIGGCSKCAGLVYDSSEILSKLSDMFPNYDYTNSEYVNSTKLMEVRCKLHDSIFRQSHYAKNECPKCSKERRLRDRIAAGRAKDPSTLTDYEKYKKAVWKETNNSYKSHADMLGERNRTRHLDHIYSILHGFRDNIDPVILGNIVNLRIIDSKVNQSKSMNSDYTKEELMKLYEEETK